MVTTQEIHELVKELNYGYHRNLSCITDKNDDDKSLNLYLFLTQSLFL